MTKANTGAGTNGAAPKWPGGSGYDGTKKYCQCCCHARTHMCDADTWDCEHCKPVKEVVMTTIQETIAQEWYECLEDQTEKAMIHTLRVQREKQTKKELIERLETWMRFENDIVVLHKDQWEVFIQSLKKEGI